MVSSGPSGLPTFSYGAGGSGLDGEGRVTQVTASSGQSPLVKGVTYTNSGAAQPIGSLTQVILGSDDNDTFSYDPHTGRMVWYKFNIGATPQTVEGDLTWNTNGTLVKLQITDPFDTANNQTCTFGYDDQARSTSANCGTSWNQTFTFDPFGNVTKTGTSSFQPGYDETRNWFTSLPGLMYDNNGNLKNDSYHTYSWDAENKLTAIDSVSMTFDALGRMVEQNRGGIYTQIVYDPTGGKFALMNGLSTIVKAYVLLPGGATAVYNSSGLAYYRHSDWLGSSRLATTPTRTKYYDGAYAPFGENYAGSGTTDLNFTGQNQDTTANYYDFLFREYSMVQGRWMSPDPAGMAVTNPANPQSWNRYAYVVGQPLVFTDRLGLWFSGWAWYDFGQALLNAWNTTVIVYGEPMGSVGSGAFGGFAYGYETGQVLTPRRMDGYQGGDGPAANNGTKVSCAGKTVLLPQNYRVQSDANGMITAVGIPLTGSSEYTAGPVTIPPNTIVGVGLEQSGALTVAVNNPIYYSAGFFGAYISSASYSNGAFTQVSGTRAVLGIPLSSSQTPSGYLLNQFNQNSSLANTASLLQSVAQLGQKLVGCSALTGGS